MKKQTVFLMGLFVAFVVSGCYSAQQLRERRILHNQDLFSGFPADVQEQVRNGFINIGFNKDMVLLAWGAPDRIVSRITQAGETIVWEYTRVESYYHPDRMSFPVYYTDRYGNVRTVYQGAWFDYETRREYTVARVEFFQGVVSTIERLNP